MAERLPLSWGRRRALYTLPLPRPPKFLFPPYICQLRSLPVGYSSLRLPLAVPSLGHRISLRFCRYIDTRFLLLMRYFPMSSMLTSCFLVHTTSSVHFHSLPCM